MASSYNPPIKKLKISLSSLEVRSVDDSYTPEHKTEPYSHHLEKKTNRKRHKKKQSYSAYKAKHSQWRPGDDYLLVNSVIQLSDITAVFKKVKFTNFYTEKEIEQRWKELLTNEIRSQVALDAINNMSVWIKSQLDHRVPFSELEEQQLRNVTFSQVYPKTERGVIPSKSTTEPFSKLLAEKADIFYIRRSVKDLFNYWNLLRKNGFIVDDPSFSSKRTFQMGGDPDSFEDMEFLITHSPVLTPREMLSGETSSRPGGSHTGTTARSRPPSISLTGSSLPSSSVTAHQPAPQSDSDIFAELEEELVWSERRRRHQLRVVGEEARRWTYWVESVTGVGITDRLPSHALASLTGAMSRYLIKGREATFGRRNAVLFPDIDLSCEYHAARISRIQGRIRLDDFGTFHLANFGQRPVFVDGAPVLTGEEVILRDTAIISIAQLNFRFDINPDLSEVSEGLLPSSKPLVPTNLPTDLLTKSKPQSSQQHLPVTSLCTPSRSGLTPGTSDSLRLTIPNSASVSKLLSRVSTPSIQPSSYVLDDDEFSGLRGDGVKSSDSLNITGEISPGLTGGPTTQSQQPRRKQKL